MDNIKDLEVLINSHYPIIYIEIFEETRVETLVLEVSFNMGLPLFIWSATTGLARFGNEKPAYNTKSPSESRKLNTEFIAKEFENTYPLSMTMQEKIERLRDWAKGRTVPAN
jgi:hypothetical protein